MKPPKRARKRPSVWVTFGRTSGLAKSVRSTAPEVGEWERYVPAADLEKAKELLLNLMTWQNGPPLPTYEKGWNKAMDEAEEFLKDQEGGSDEL